MKTIPATIISEKHVEMSKRKPILTTAVRVIAWTGGTSPERLSTLMPFERALVRFEFRCAMLGILKHWGNYKGMCASTLSSARLYWNRARRNVHATMQTKEGRIAFADNVWERQNQLREWLGSANSYKPEELPIYIYPPTNAEISRGEVYRFMDARPSKKNGYLSMDGKRITTYTGETLASVTYTGTTFTGNMGNEWTPFRATGINGRQYFGRHNGPGMCLTMRAIKRATK